MKLLVESLRTIATNQSHNLNDSERDSILEAADFIEVAPDLTALEKMKQDYLQIERQNCEYTARLNEALDRQDATVAQRDALIRTVTLLVEKL